MPLWIAHPLACVNWPRVATSPEAEELLKEVGGIKTHVWTDEMDSKKKLTNVALAVLIHFPLLCRCRKAPAAALSQSHQTSACRCSLARSWSAMGSDDVVLAFRALRGSFTPCPL
eukprot:336310-Amphidinium_carterae.2